jgi:4-amino-4-deoxy-L-arabinose transferase-like glycosyltransferase
VRLFALVLSDLIPTLQPYVFWGDATGYTQLAVNLLTEGAFRFNGGTATAFRMPGYPSYLALTYATVGSPLIAQLFQIIADLVVMLCTLRISEYLFKDRSVGLIAIMVIAVHPVFILSSVTLYPESLGVLFTTLALLILLKSDNSIKKGLLAGAALSAAIYLKTNMLLVALAMLMVVGLKMYFSQGLKGFFKSTVPAILMIGLTMLPWVVRNWVVLGEFIPTTTSNGVNMYRGNNPLADGGAASNQPYVLPGMSEVESSKGILEGRPGNG